MSLALSLLFAVGQVLLGGIVALRIARSGRWRTVAQYVLMLVAVWFIASGVCELLVSGMEMARHVSGHPSATAFAAWRSQIDLALVIVTCGLVVLVALFPLARRLPAAPKRTTGASVDGKPGS